MRIRFQLLLILLVALVVFYPTLFAELCRVDDLQMITSLKATEYISLKDLFIPGTSQGIYYRPLVFVSFYIDRFVFDLDCFSMHLHNVLLHVANALLLFWIARKLLRILKHDFPYIPLIAALLFLLHPIATESVNWISGRTDVLAATFLLACTGLLLSYVEQTQRFYLYGAFLLFVCAVLTKEFSLAFLPAFIWLAAYNHPLRLSPKTWFMLALLGVSAVGAFLLLRSMAFTSNQSSISVTLKVIFNTPGHSLQLVLTAIGFYFKKLFIPYPLNFAIYEVNALYEFVAWPILLLLVYIAWKRTLLSVLFLTGIVLISPALVIVFNQIAWTPFAERYLYLPSAFVTLATTCYLRKNLAFPNDRVRVVSVLLVLSVCAGMTFQRNLVWQTTDGIVFDTARKSPESSALKFVMAHILIQRSEYAEARKILETVKSRPGLFYDEQGDLFEAEILIREGNRIAAIKQLEYVVKSSNNKSLKALNKLIEMYNEEGKRDHNTNFLQYRTLTLKTRKKLFRVTHEATLLYEMGNDTLLLGDSVNAENYFRLATQNIAVTDAKNKRAYEMLKRVMSERSGQ